VIPREPGFPGAAPRVSWRARQGLRPGVAGLDGCDQGSKSSHKAATAIATCPADGRDRVFTPAQPASTSFIGFPPTSPSSPLGLERSPLGPEYHPGRCTVDRPVRPRRLHHGAKDATRDQGASRTGPAARLRPPPLSLRADPVTKPSTRLSPRHRQRPQQDDVRAVTLATRTVVTHAESPERTELPLSRHALQLVLRTA
jgi:hypothetical protein